MIEIEKLSKTFKVHVKQPGFKASLRSLFKRDWREVHALREVSLRIEKGEILGLVGANGAGKTTLVKILAGIIHPTSGSAKVLGHTPWERENAFRQQIALVMGQKAQLWWDLPAADCFLLLREIYRVPVAEHKKRLDHLTEALDVGDKLNIQVRRLSLGERMKMELIATLLHQPQIVFLDEPTIGLDISAQRNIREFLLQYREEHQPAMMLTSHYMEDIEQLCERVVIIKDGSFIYDGPLREIVSTYAPYKIVDLRFKDEFTEQQALKDLIVKSDSKILRENGQSLRLEVRDASVAEVTSALTGLAAVADLKIENEEITSVIERIMKG